MVVRECSFQFAKPVWECTTETEMNRVLVFSANIVGGGQVLLRLAGSSMYRVFINQKIIHWGPARAAKGYFRVDELQVGDYLTSGNNLVEIEVTGYYCSSYDWLRVPSFLCAELLRGGEMIAATGVNGWKCCHDGRKIQRTSRYSFQRTFSEAYDYRLGKLEEVKTETAQAGLFIERNVPAPSMIYEPIQSIPQSGKVAWLEEAPECKSVFLTRAGKKFDGYPMEIIDVNQVGDALHLSLYDEKECSSVLPVSMPGNTFLTAKMAGNRTGLIRLSVACTEDCDLYLTFDEILVDGRIDFLRMDCANVILYRLRGGERYEILTAEPYTLQYMNIIPVGGGIVLEKVGIVRIDLDPNEIIFHADFSPDEADIEEIYDAAIETFRQNTLDIFMDCPSRERAGWLCDSFFTGRVEKLLTGKNTVEKNFLSNFIMADDFSPLPQGMIPMCYPADHPNGNYIPNWAMWFIAELNDYFERTGDSELVLQAKDRAYGILNALKKFENAEGLLERLEGWVFIEWSKSNALVQDINYPSNMMYYLVKKLMSRLYGDTELEKEAERLRNTIRRNSRYGLFFCDNSIYRDGVPVLSGECTESAQYYAFFTGVATQEEDAELWNVLVRDFGPERKKTGLWKEIYFSNAFIGNYLRLELLDRAGEHEKLKENIRGYFGYMAKRTGTLWENDTESASCNHGFASHVLVWLSHLGYGHC